MFGFCSVHNVRKQCYILQEMVIKEPGSGYSVGGVDPQTALQALKIKAKVGRRARAKRDAAAAMLVPLDRDGQIHHTEDQFLNEQEIVEDGVSVKKEQVNSYVRLLNEV
jgi:hypothetical protein